MHRLPNIARSKGNQIIKLCELIEYDIKSIFLEKSYTKCGGEAIPRPYSENPRFFFAINLTNIRCTN